MLDDNEFFLYGLSFKNRLYELNGQSFEDFFVRILMKYDSDFQAVKAYGKIGDRKNDGFNKKTGHYYQVYSPESLIKSLSDAKNKLKEDFKGLFQHWDKDCKINKFTFVINDKYKGIPEPIHKCLLDLEKEHKDIEFKILNSENISKIFFSLNKQDIISLIGLIPSVELLYDDISMSALIDVVNYLLEKPNNVSFVDKAIAPDFKEKITFNNLSSNIDSLLSTANLQVGNIESYFETNPSHRSILQKKFKELYDEAKKTFDEENQMFMYILSQSVPDENSSKQSATLVLMSYYFETCDIFETPIEIKK